MKVSVVIPTYNESQDIEATLKAVLGIDYPDIEIIVVDDSTDETPEIVRKYEKCGVRLIRPVTRSGRCEARNRGIEEASGEVLLILNADVRPDRDFLKLVTAHIEQGYDYILVNSKISNTEYLYPRYVECVGLVGYDNIDPKWSEGFVCRKSCAVNAGLFPTGFLVPICAGEDADFGERLKKTGAKRKIDHSIVIKHKAPESLHEYWHIRKGRGRGSPQIHIFLQEWSIPKVIFWAFLRWVKTLLEICFIFPALFAVGRIVSHSPKGWRDFLGFLWSWLVERFAFHVGEAESIFQILGKNENK
jgi:glycosyltransferase involved in cell wall biosynthesis